MADFCKQCSIDMWGKDTRDLAIGDDARVDSDPHAQVHDRYLVMCEGCTVSTPVTDNPNAYTVVDKDGTCVVDCNLHHGTETAEDWKRMGAMPS